MFTNNASQSTATATQSQAEAARSKRLMTSLVSALVVMVVVLAITTVTTGHVPTGLVVCLTCLVASIGVHVQKSKQN